MVFTRVCSHKLFHANVTQAQEFIPFVPHLVVEETVFDLYSDAFTSVYPHLQKVLVYFQQSYDD